jgi:hypothetical protein
MSGTWNTNWTVGKNGYMTSTGSGVLFVGIDLREGDRIKSVTFMRYGNGMADFTDCAVRLITSAGATSTLGASGMLANPPASWIDTTINVIDTIIAAGDSVHISFSANAAGLRVGSIRVTYDRP